MIRNRTAPVRNNEAQLGELPKEVSLEKLHEGGRVSVYVVGPRGVEVRVATARHVNHRRNVEFDHLLVHGKPRRVGEREPVPKPPARIGTEVETNEAQLENAALEFGDGAIDGHAG